MLESIMSGLAFLADGSFLSQMLLAWLSASVTCYVLTRWSEFLFGSLMAVVMIGHLALR